MEVRHTGSPGEKRGAQRGESQPLLLNPEIVFVLCEQWWPSSELAALIMQPAETEVKPMEKELNERAEHGDTQEER
ncbi:Hypothetical predicted protein [Xyrichtys novacula]|uniref:Uncharacterized protein n=1 Tax=Xyrichtys novacula TaxID=13765 RepID=A0AAV1FID4_XYRNO|nr:Hypothetical predicted protein [Xyrichtys novacula]